MAIMQAQQILEQINTPEAVFAVKYMFVTARTTIQSVFLSKICSALSDAIEKISYLEL